MPAIVQLVTQILAPIYYGFSSPITERASGGNGTNIALNVPDRKCVREFNRVALELGGTDDGPPGIREVAHPNFYAGYIVDLDGNKLVVVCHAEQSE